MSIRQVSHFQWSRSSLCDSNLSKLKLIAFACPNFGTPVQLGLFRVFVCSWLFLSIFRKKTKIAPGVIQISSKSRLSTWSKPYIKPRSKSFVHDSKDDFSLASFRRCRLGSLPTSFSDSCLAKRGLNDEEEFNISSASAPQSCSSGSGSEDDDKTSGETDPMDYYDPEVSLVLNSQKTRRPMGGQKYYLKW